MIASLYPTESSFVQLLLKLWNECDWSFLVIGNVTIYQQIAVQSNGLSSHSS